MKAFFQVMLRFISAYGLYIAGRPSIHGFYEPKVPDEVQRVTNHMNNR